jgi:hypothetical protein
MSPTKWQTAGGHLNQPQVCRRLVDHGSNERLGHALLRSALRLHGLPQVASHAERSAFSGIDEPGKNLPLAHCSVHDCFLRCPNNAEYPRRPMARAVYLLTSLTDVQPVSAADQRFAKRVR